MSESVEERYNSDPEFHSLVIMMYHMIGDRFTPSEMREALIFAFTLYEMRRVRYSEIAIPVPDEYLPALSKNHRLMEILGEGE